MLNILNKKKLKYYHIVMNRKLIHCSKCNKEVKPVKKAEFDKLLRATINASPLTLKELKTQLKKDRENKKHSK